jgi:hypothetical protein
MISVVLAIVYSIVYLFSCHKDSGHLGQPCPHPAIVSVQHFHHFAARPWVDVSYAVMLGRITSAPCATCGRTIQVRLDGKVKIHGPQVNCRSGSGKLPRIAAAPILVPSQQTPSSTSSQLAPTPTDVVIPPSTVNPGSFDGRILKRIPRASRSQTAQRLTSILSAITARNDVDSWERLILFPRRCLAAPKRGGHRRNLALIINQAVMDEACRSYHTTRERTPKAWYCIQQPSCQSIRQT